MEQIVCFVTVRVFTNLRFKYKYIFICKTIYDGTSGGHISTVIMFVFLYNRFVKAYVFVCMFLACGLYVYVTIARDFKQNVLKKM